MSRRRWSQSTVGIDPVMIALLTFTCTILIRVALAGSQ